MTLTEKVLSRVVKQPSGCWEWQGATNSGGYGYLWHAGRMVRAHRAIMGFPEGFVLHLCDNPRCVNPDHLRVGAHADNMADMVAKGRQNLGERNPQARLTPMAVRVIRRLAGKVSQREMGRIWGVSRATIYNIAQRKTWRHL